MQCLFSIRPSKPLNWKFTSRNTTGDVWSNIAQLPVARSCAPKGTLSGDVWWCHFRWNGRIFGSTCTIPSNPFRVTWPSVTGSHGTCTTGTSSSTKYTGFTCTLSQSLFRSPDWRHFRLKDPTRGDIARLAVVDAHTSAQDNFRSRDFRSYVMVRPPSIPRKYYLSCTHVLLLWFSNIQLRVYFT